MSEWNFDEAIDRRGTDSIKWDDAPGDRLAMGLADMDFRAAPAILDALHEQVERGVFGYTAAGPGFMSAVCAWSERRRDWRVQPEWITPTSGVMPAIIHLLAGALCPGDEVIVQTPAFAPIPDAVERNGLRVVENPLRFADGRYAMDFDDLRRAAARPATKAFVLCSPHNPSGRIWSRGDLETVATIAGDHDLLVISDEIHAEVVFPWARFTTYGRVAREGAPFAVCFGPSKGFNLAGLQISLTAVPDPGLRSRFHDELSRVNADFGVNAQGAAALRAAYTDGGPWLDALTGYLAGNLQLLTDRLEADLPEVTVIRPDASFLVWLDCRGTGLSDAELLRRLGDDAGVVVEPGVHFGKAGSGFVRFNIGTTRARVGEAVERMVRVLHSNGP